MATAKSLLKPAVSNKAVKVKSSRRLPFEPEPLVHLFHGNALEVYPRWPAPVVIVSDGAYGLRSFHGDPPTAEGLVGWYEPHVAAWTKHATPQTTLWFWNSELGWATVHPTLVRYGWEFRNCHIWDKGIAHVAGNSNTKTLRKFPVVTEVCVQYVRAVKLPFEGGWLSLKDWLRAEWQRTGLPLSKTNEACGVKNAATRKYFTQDHLWYFPPPPEFEMLVAYANQQGNPAGRPYFSVDGHHPLTGEEWSRMRSKFSCRAGITNVWREPAVRGKERLKQKWGCAHANQKPVKLLERIIECCSDPGDVIWEPFGGLCSVAVAAYQLGRACYSAEIHQEYYDLARDRLGVD